MWLASNLLTNNATVLTRSTQPVWGYALTVSFLFISVRNAKEPPAQLFYEFGVNIMYKHLLGNLSFSLFSVLSPFHSFSFSPFLSLFRSLFNLVAVTKSNTKELLRLGLCCFLIMPIRFSTCPNSSSWRIVYAEILSSSKKCRENNPLKTIGNRRTLV